MTTTHYSPTGQLVSTQVDIRGRVVSAPRATRVPRVVMAGRGDPLVGHLSRALADRYPLVGEVDAELTQPERMLVAARTFRPSRRDWVERFYKSNLAVSLCSARAGRRLADHPTAYDVVLQTHALFELTDPRAVLYIDCTHQQSMRQWPDWNPLRGRELERWLERERRQYHAAAHLFAFSQQTRESIVVDYGVPAERVTVVGAGVNFEHVPDQAQVGNTNTAPTILFVGNDFVRKGGEQLLEAFRVVRERVADAQLQIVGTPYPIAAQPGVEVLGRVNGRSKMTRLYASADVFAMPSFFDPFPLVVLEAMAHGLPVVASPTCGVPEMVVDGRTGLFVATDASMVERLADALVAVLTDPARAAAMGRAGRERVTERFLWRHVADRMAPVLQGMAGRAGGPSSIRVPSDQPPSDQPPPTHHHRPTTTDPPSPTRTALVRHNQQGDTMTDTIQREAAPSEAAYQSERPWGRFEVPPGSGRHRL